MIPLSKLKKKYLGLYCTDTMDVIECLPWNVVSVGAPVTTPFPSSIGHQPNVGFGFALFLLAVITFFF